MSLGYVVMNGAFILFSILVAYLVYLLLRYGPLTREIRESPEWREFRARKKRGSSAKLASEGLDNPGTSKHEQDRDNEKR